MSKIDKYLKIIKNNFPELILNKYKLLDYTWDFDVVILDNTKVFRFPKRDNVKKNLKQEIALLNVLKEKTTANVPNYSFLANDNLFAVCNFIEGKKITSHYLGQLSKTKRLEISKQVALFINSLHGINYISLDIKLPKIKSEEEILDLQLNIKNFLVDKLKEEELIIIQNFILEYQDIVKDSYTQRIIHSDLHSEHLLWNEDESSLGVIDFSDCRLSLIHI